MQVKKTLLVLVLLGNKYDHFRLHVAKQQIMLRRCNDFSRVNKSKLTAVGGL